MPLGEILVGKNLLDQKQLETALERQKVAGGRLGDNLVALGFLSKDVLDSIFQEPPSAPLTLFETGLDVQFITSLVLKSFYVVGPQTVPNLAQFIKLPRSILDGLVRTMKKEGLLEVLGAADAHFSVLTYTLTTQGRARALEALQQSQYAGPAPVPLTHYTEHVLRQTITNERINIENLADSLSHLVISEELMRRLGPAINSGRAMLLFGPSGNGKSSIAEAIGKTFQQTIHIPYCIEVDGQVIRIYDPAVHDPVDTQVRSSVSEDDEDSIFSGGAQFDHRWVPCRRPVIVTGGELTLEMLDLDFEPISKYYEAPLQVKATGGMFIIDDFGRQLVRPQDLLNRWIIPLEKKIDYLTLHTGKKFQMAFDELVVFSTNIPPHELMDAALLRRVPYKLEIEPPTIDQYKAIFRRVCDTHKLSLSEDLLAYLIEDYYPNNGAAPSAFHPRFIVEHAVAACKYEGIAPRLTFELLSEALANLLILKRSAHTSGGVAQRA